MISRQGVDLTGEARRKIIEFRRELHRHPELANREKWTMHRIVHQLKAIGISGIRTRVAKTGVVACLKGTKAGSIIGIRMPMDAFPVAENTSVPYKSAIRDVSHSCGHDAMMAMALGAAEILSDRPGALRHDVRLIFQPAEEGIPEGETGGALAMIKRGALKGLRALITLHVDSDLPFGSAGVHEGAVYAAADDWILEIIGKAAHGATPWKGIDAIAVAGRIISALRSMVRPNDLRDPMVLHIGTIKGGTARNAVADSLTMTGTLRTYSRATREKARRALMRSVTKIASAHGAKANLRFTSETPATTNNPALVRRLRPILEDMIGRSHVKRLAPMPYKDDFAFMAEKVPSFYFQLGILNKKKGITAPTHSASFNVDEEAIPLGARLLASLVLELMEGRLRI